MAEVAIPNPPIPSAEYDDAPPGADQADDTCQHCGGDLFEGAAYCRHCGEKVEAMPKSDLRGPQGDSQDHCDQCGSELISGDRSCRECGTPVDHFDTISHPKPEAANLVTEPDSAIIVNDEEAGSQARPLPPEAPSERRRSRLVPILVTLACLGTAVVVGILLLGGSGPRPRTTGSPKHVYQVYSDAIDRIDAKVICATVSASYSESVAEGYGSCEQHYEDPKNIALLTDQNTNFTIGNYSINGDTANLKVTDEENGSSFTEVLVDENGWKVDSEK